MTLIAPQAELDKLHAHAEAGYPHEVVGILAGKKETGELLKVHPLINERADSAHNRYKVSGLTLMRAEQALEAEGRHPRLLPLAPGPSLPVLRVRPGSCAPEHVLPHRFCPGWGGCGHRQLAASGRPNRHVL